MAAAHSLAPNILHITTVSALRGPFESMPPQQAALHDSAVDASSTSERAPTQSQNNFDESFASDDGERQSQGTSPFSSLQKRRRVTRACDECRRKKIRCDGKVSPIRGIPTVPDFAADSCAHRSHARIVPSMATTAPTISPHIDGETLPLIMLKPWSVVFVASRPLHILSSQISTSMTLR